MERKKILELAEAFGLKDSNKLINAFDVTKKENGSKNSKGLYANSSLSTLGDAVLKLYIVNNGFKRGMKSNDIAEELKTYVSNERLSEVCKSLKYPELRHGGTKQPSDSLKDDPASLFEAVVGAIFADKGFEETGRILDEHILKLN